LTAACSAPERPTFRHRAKSDRTTIWFESAEAAGAFKRAFDARFASGQALPFGEQ
jgi:hypothetical protein